MSQSELMMFFDEHIGCYYTGVEIVTHFDGTINKATLYKNLQRIVKRQRYNCILTHKLNSTRLTAMYGREE